MRFGISATSWIFPKNLRTRLRPVNVCAVISPLSVGPSGPGRLSGRPQSIATIRTGVEAPVLYLRDSALCQTAHCDRRKAEIVVISETCPKSPSFVCPVWGLPAANGARSGPDRPCCCSGLHALLELDLGADLLQGGFDLLSLVLRNGFLDRLGSRLDQVLGFLEAETSRSAHFLDHLDLLVANRGKDDRELGLLLDRRSGSSAWSGRHGNRSCRRHPPLLFQHLRKLSRFQHGQA